MALWGLPGCALRTALGMGKGFPLLEGGLQLFVDRRGLPHEREQPGAAVPLRARAELLATGDERGQPRVVGGERLEFPAQGLLGPLGRTGRLLGGCRRGVRAVADRGGQLGRHRHGAGLGGRDVRGEGRRLMHGGSFLSTVFGFGDVFGRGLLARLIRGCRCIPGGRAFSPRRQPSLDVDRGQLGVEPSRQAGEEPFQPALDHRLVPRVVYIGLAYLRGRVTRLDPMHVMGFREVGVLRVHGEADEARERPLELRRQLVTLQHADARRGDVAARAVYLLPDEAEGGEAGGRLDERCPADAEERGALVERDRRGGVRGLGGTGGDQQEDELVGLGQAAIFHKALRDERVAAREVAGQPSGVDGYAERGSFDDGRRLDGDVSSVEERLPRLAHDPLGYAELAGDGLLRAEASALGLGAAVGGVETEEEFRVLGDPRILDDGFRHGAVAGRVQLGQLDTSALRFVSCDGSHGPRSFFLRRAFVWKGPPC